MEWVYLETFFNTELSICNKIIKLNDSKNSKKIKDIEKEIEKVEKTNTIELSEKQKEAIKAVNKHNVTIITGGPRNRKNDNNKINYRNIPKTKQKNSTSCSNRESCKKNDRNDRT